MKYTLETSLPGIIVFNYYVMIKILNVPLNIYIVIVEKFYLTGRDLGIVFLRFLGLAVLLGLCADFPCPPCACAPAP